MATLTANATANLTAAGTSTGTGSISWNAPQLPEGAILTDVRISGKWTWGGKGSILRVTINGTNTSDGIAFDIDITGKTSPLSITCVGGNKNATGANFKWSNLIVTYTYDMPVTEIGKLKIGGQLVSVTAVKQKVSGQLVDVDADVVFSTSDKLLWMN